MTASIPKTAAATNAEVDWEDFEPEEYAAHNYGSLRDDDRLILEKVRDFFAKAEVSGARGVDIGSGSNIYPALTMLPFCKSIELREFSARNVGWLRRQINNYEDNWDKFWDVLRQDSEFAKITDPREKLARVATAKQASIFDLPRNEWDMGTMFFVACSLSSDMQEFQAAIESFVGSLTPSAPYAAAFMIKSGGYLVGDKHFPAVAVTAGEVEECLSSVSEEGLVIVPVETDTPLRDGVGMLLALGRAAG